MSNHQATQTLAAPAFDELQFRPWRRLSRLPVILQDETAECGLACLAMVCSYFGRRIDLATLRNQLGVLPEGTNLKQLMAQAGKLGMSTQAVRAELSAFRNLYAPCILHWGQNHFVVLRKAGRRHLTIHDPRVGLVRLTYAKAAEQFTGYALEFQPNTAFEAKDERRVPTLRSLMGRTRGLASALAQIFCLALLLELVGLVSPAIMQWLVDNGLESGDQGLILGIVGGMGLLMLISLVVGLLRSWMVMYLSISLGFQWSSRILTHLLHLPVDYFERRHMGDVMSRFGSVSAIQQTVTTGVIEGVLDGLLASATLVMIWLYSPALALTAIAALAALTALQLATFSTQKRIGNESLVADAKVSSNFLESIRGIRSLKLANRMDARRSTWQKLTVDSINVKVRGQWLGIMIGAAGTLISGTQRLLAIYLAATLIGEGKFTVGMLFAYLAYQDQFMGRSGALVGLYFQFKMLRLHFERLADIVLTEPEQLPHFISDQNEHKDSEEPASVGSVQRLPDGPCSIEFREVSFKYSEFARPVLERLSFSSAGTGCTVITGRTGAGKTTLFKILLGIYRPTSGQVLINDVPIEHLPVDVLRDQIACVLQDDALFAGSVRENIAFFDPQIDQTRVEECARIACVHEDIQRMLMGYHTLVGDMGSTLSAGQKQRVLLARALYRQPRILLLDEATSDLDVATEEQVNRNLAELDLHRIYIAHRPQTIMFGERVVQL